LERTLNQLNVMINGGQQETQEELTDEELAVQEEEINEN